jgi:elongation factor 2
MVKFSTDDIHHAMEKRRNIRNISIAAHVDAGKSTTSDSLLNKAGIISDDDTGEKRGTDTRQDEQDRCITIKSTGVSLYYNMNNEDVPEDSEGNGYLINLIDSPGHVDFSSEVTAALRVTDGVMVLLCGINGVAVQTETVLKQALDEMIKPVCFVNKLDRLILELQLSSEEIYQKMYSHIAHLNQLINTYNTKMPPMQLSPEKGQVGFGCGIMGWGFTLPYIAKRFANKMNMTPDELAQKLWGENYYNPQTNKWTTSKKKGYVRGFNFFCIDRIQRVFKVMLEGSEDDIQQQLERMNIKLGEKDKDKDGKKLVKKVMQQFLPLADSLLTMVVKHLPSPVEAQRYRVDHLYTGPAENKDDDEVYQAIKNCDPNGPLCMYVSKLFPSPDLSRFYAFGRVFSGTVKVGDVNVQGPAYIIGGKDDFFKTKVQKVAIMMAAKAESIPNCPSGNTVALVGVDQFIAKTATITDREGVYNIRDMKFTVSPVVSCAVKCGNPAELPKLIKGLKLLSRSDPLCLIRMEEDTGEIIISGAGELHLEICLQDLEEMFARGIKLIKSPPVVPFRETIIDASSQICLAKSPNKHNRLYLTAEPLNPELVNDIVEGKIGTKMDSKERARLLTAEHNWSKDEALKIWSFSETEPGNVVVDAAKGVQYLNEIKDSVLTGFQNVAMSGPLCEEPIRGVKFNIKDVTLHADAIHRGGGQIIAPTRRSMYASMLTAQPRLLEPVYLADIQCPIDTVGSVYSVISQRRGEIINEDQNVPANSATLTAYLPVAESFGFTDYLRSQTGGKAFPQCSFSHWQVINDDPLEEGSKANEIVKSIRKRKGLSEDIPPLSNFLDKL